MPDLRFRLRVLPVLLFLCLLLPREAGAQSSATVPHLRVELIASEAALIPGRPLRLGLRFELEKDWHVYWKNPGDSGQPPAVTWSFQTDGATPTTMLRADELSWPTPHRLVTGPLADYGYEQEVVLLTSLHSDPALRERAITITAAVSWLVCSEPCIPGEAKLTLKLPVRTADAPPVDAKMQALFAAAERALPTPLLASMQVSGRQEKDAFFIRVKLGELTGVTQARFFPLHAGEIDNVAAQESARAGDGLSLKLKVAEQLATPVSSLAGLLQFDFPTAPARTFAVEIPISPETAAANAATVTPTPAPSAPPQVWVALLFALLGGMLLNLMPCVFPVLCIKALGLVEMSAADRRQARGHAVAYTAGILLSFWMLSGLLLALRYTGQKIGWGFHLQSPRFLIGLSGLLFLLGLNLLGVFELGLGLTRLGQLTAGERFDRRSYFGAFATGVLATVVATPCTAPFMGTAVGFALTQPAVVALSIFSAVGLGLALPYVLLLWVPGLLRILPRPGAWMETFKHLMGFLLFGTVLWLAWVLGAQSSAERVVALFGGLLAIGIAAWVLHRFAESSVAIAIAVLLILAGVVAPGWGLVPGSKVAQLENSDDDLPWQRFSPEQLAAHRAAGTPVFLDFTAEWCVSCKVNERLVLRSAAVRTRMRELGIVPMKADWTNYDPLITQKLAEFGRSGIPFYVLYGRGKDAPWNELPAVLTTGIVLHALEQVQQENQKEKP